jgi:hypothetical protein
MAKKYSDNPIPDGNYSVDWGNDNSVNLPYSGEAVQDFIKNELQKKQEEADVDKAVQDQIGSTFFNEQETTDQAEDGDKVITGISGTSELLTINYKVKDASGVMQTRTKDIDISTVDVNARFLRITTSMDNSFINVGGNVKFNYGYAVTDYEGAVIENQAATAVINLYRQGSATPFYTTNLGNIASASSTGTATASLDLTQILKKYFSTSATVIATLSLSYTYSYMKGEEAVSGTVNSQSSALVTIISLTLSTGINFATNYSVGQISIPYTIRGNGTKIVSLYKNGNAIDTQESITASSYSNTFVQDLNSSTNYQLVAEASAGNTTVKSSSYYFDLTIPLSGTSIGIMHEDTYGEIKNSSQYSTPEFKSPIYESFNLSYFVYSSTSSQIALKITTEELNSEGNVVTTSTSEQKVGRSICTYSKRIKSANTYKVTLEAGDAKKIFYILPQIGSINIEIPTDSIALNLDADGRSNEETTPAVWKYGDYSTEFSGVNWDSDGWVSDEGSTALLLQNGATAVINYPLFSPINGTSPANNEGCTFEILLKVSNISTSSTPIVKCAWESNSKTVGLNITNTFLGVNTEDTRVLPSDDADASKVEEPVSVGQQYSEGEYYKYTFVMDKITADGTSLYKAYINGILSYAAPITGSTVINNLNGVPITIDSTAADIYIKSIKYYTRALSHNECVNSAIIDKSTVAEIEEEYNDNDIYAEDSLGKEYISPRKIHDKGHGVMIFTPSQYQTTKYLLEDINDITDKKAKGYVFRIDFFAPANALDLTGTSNGVGAEKGDKFNFTHLGCDVTIQGTTSANRPRKNYRVNFNKNQLSVVGGSTGKEPYKNTKGNAYTGDFYINGSNKEKGENGDAAKFKYSLDANQTSTTRVCLKTDYVDSSMIHNTGGALVWNEITSQLDSIKNPAQKRDSNVRVAINGFPIDIFQAESITSTLVDSPATELSDDNYTNLKYMGQFNFNNDKSKTGALFGFDGQDNGSWTMDIATKTESDGEHFDPNNTTGTYNAEGKGEAICLEFLNNTMPLNVFWVGYDSNGNVDDSYFEGSNFANALELRAPAMLTDFISADSQGDFKNTWAAHSELTKGGLQALYLDQATLSEFETEAGSDYAGDGSTLMGYRWMADCIKRPFKFIAECVKEVAANNGITTTQLNEYIKSEDIKSTGIFDSWNWTSAKFTEGASNYFNVSNICAWYIWTDYMMAVDQRAKNMMFYTHDALHWMFQYYDGDTVLGESNDCALAYDYLTTKDTYDSARGQYAFQGHASWLWYLVRANLDSQLKSVCNEMRTTSQRFSDTYLKEIFNNQIVGNWNERLYNESQQYKYIDQLTDEKGSNRRSTAYLNTVQGSRLAHRNYLIDNRFSMLDAKYQTNTWRENDSTVINLGTLGNTYTIKSATPYTFGIRRASRPITDVQSTSKENDYTVTLTLNSSADVGSSNEPMFLCGQGRATYIKLIGNLISTSASNPTTFTSKVLETIDLSEVTGGNFISLNGTYSLKTLDIHTSDIATIEGLKTCQRLESFDARETPFEVFQVGEGCVISDIKLEAPSTIILSNLPNVRYYGDDNDTLVVQDWTKLSKVVINNVPHVNMDLILDKLAASSATSKAVRIEGIEKTTSITWLNQFENCLGLDTASDGTYTITNTKTIYGTITLPEYIDDDIIADYRKKYPYLEIKQPEFTLIRSLETSSDIEGALITNVDNSTGYGTNSSYTPSGHISNILNNTHRYLGKVVVQGTRTKYVIDNGEEILNGQLNDSDEWGQWYWERKNDGQMVIIQLADEDSNYFAEGYESASTRQKATLDGAPGNGEVGVVIPHFWYKGVSYFTPQDQSHRYNFTAYSTYTELPSTQSDEVKVLKVKDLFNTAISGEEDGLYQDNAYIYASTSTSSYRTVDSRITISNYAKVIRVKVEGYKKIQIPISVGCASVFTDAEGTIFTDKDGTIDQYSQVVIGTNNYVCNGIAMLTTIPLEAKYLYITVKTNTTNNPVQSGNITPEYCDIILHKGSNFNSGDDMTLENAREWIMDFEPNWVEHDREFIAAAECTALYKDNGEVTLYSPFDRTQHALVGTTATNVTVLNPQMSQEYNSYYLRYLAERRGMQLIDYEASKLIAMLFFAKYGLKNSQEQLGGGEATTNRYLGDTADMGMKDTICKSFTTEKYINSDAVNDVVYSSYTWTKTGNAYSYTKKSSNNFLGIENVSGNVLEFMDKVFYMNETNANCSKARITMPDSTIRRIYTINTNGSYPISLVHGRYCDIFNAGALGGSTSSGYGDYQYVDTYKRSSLASTQGITRSDGGAAVAGGVVHLRPINLNFSTTNMGSRLMFRGTLTEVTDIQTFKNAIDNRTLADDDRDK